MSLRTSIVALAVGAAAAVLLLFTVPVALSTLAAEGDEAEQEAVTLVQGVADVVSSSTADRGDIEAVVERANGRRNDTPVTVVLADGTSVGAVREECASVALDVDVEGDRGDRESRDDDEGRDSDLDELLPTTEVDDVDVDGGHLVRVAATGAGGDVVVCGYVSDAQVREAVTERLGALALAAVVVLLVVAAAALLVARRMARHLVVATATADRLSRGDLAARVPDAGPVEVRRVGAALNRLAGRIDELLTQERESAADLSHRLRTPLMAVRLDVESLEESAAKDELDADLDVLERTLTAVIAAARRPQREGVVPGCDAVEVVRARLDYWSPLLEDQGRSTSLVIAVDATQAPVRCAAEDLAAAIDALLENVVAHTGETVPVEVEIASVDSGGGGDGGLEDQVAEGWVRVEVRDQGPGVPSSALQRGRSDRGSSGLGLDIARACAESTGGRLELDRIDEWSVVRLVLGPADSQVVLTST
ncbi:MAG: ATP-binding region, ATPase domain protein [Nocardioides sp.]|nr:ATP-binding region, ATPase domain protein [Nocardioides sp.]